MGRPPGDEVAGPVLIKLGDKVSTDDISPSGSQVLVFRSNMPAIAEFTLPERRFRVRRARQGGERRLHRRGPDLRPGLVARGRRGGSDVPRGARRAGEELRAHPPRQPDQLGRAAPRARGPGRLRRDSAADTSSASRTSPAGWTAARSPSRTRPPASESRRAACSPRASGPSWRPVAASPTRGRWRSRRPDAAARPRRVRPRRHEPGTRLPPPRPPRPSGGLGSDLSRGAGKPRPVRAAARRPRVAGSRRSRRSPWWGRRPARTRTSTTRSARSR